MPSTTPKQARAMAIAAHEPAAAERMGIPQDVAREFNREDAKSGMLSRAMKDRPGKHGSPFETVETSNVISRRAKVPETFGGIQIGGRARPFFTDD
jgi:hypothetical protein